MTISNFLPFSPPLQAIKADFLTQKNIELWIKREDLIHPELNGNKWRKLKYNLLEAKEQDKKSLLTFGGAFSNHLFATAAAGKLFDFDTIGIVRGERADTLSPTLRFAEKSGMQLHFVSRSEYREFTTDYQSKKITQLFGNQHYILPEGGTNSLALKGCEEIVTDLSHDTSNPLTHYCVSVGTGGTAAGLVAALRGKAKVLGFSALKGNFLGSEIKKIFATCDIHSYSNWTINDDYHFGGYAKFQPELITFINDFKRQFDIPLDPVYTGKMLFGIFDLIKNNYFERGSRIVAIHTGGLQGIEGYNSRHFDPKIEFDASDPPTKKVNF